MDAAVTQNLRPFQFSRSTAYSALSVLFVVNVLNTIDRNLLVVLNEPIKLEFALSDGQIGLLSTAFALSYAAAGFPLGMAADKFSRRGIVAFCVTLWSAMTAVCGMAMTHMQLMLARIGVGAGEAGSGPAILSLISDIFPPERRATMTSIYYLSTSVGIMVGLGVGAWIAQSFGWRATFFIAAAPVVIIVPLLFLIVPEPKRSVDRLSLEQSTLRAFIHFLLVQKSLRWLIIGNIINVMVISGLGAWFVSYIVRQYQIPLASIGLYAGLLHGAMGILGTLTGGILADRFSKRDARHGLWMVAVSALLTGVTFIGVVWSPILAVSLVFYTAYCFVSSIWFGPVYALTLSLVFPRMRGKSSAFLYVVTNLAGYGIGAPLVGYLSDKLGAGSALGLGSALTLVASLSVITALCLFMSSRTLREDLARCG